MKAVFVNALFFASLLLELVGQSLASLEGRTCDDFDPCPQGWSLVASPSLVECGATCATETCCSIDVASEVIDVLPEREGRSREIEAAQARRLFEQNETNATTTSTQTTTTTYTATATATATITTTTATLTVTLTTTATTTTEPTGNEITGIMVIEVTGSAEDFINDPAIKAQIIASIASVAEVPESYITLTMAIVTSLRRLSEGSARLRRLQAAPQTVQVVYKILIPDGATVTLSEVLEKITTSTTQSFQALLLTKLQENNVTGYTLNVVEFSQPTYDLVTFTTTDTVTSTAPETEDDDSSAFTRLAFNPAHALALLAAVMSVMSP